MKKIFNLKMLTLTVHVQGNIKRICNSNCSQFKNFRKRGSDQYYLTLNSIQFSAATLEAVHNVVEMLRENNFQSRILYRPKWLIKFEDRKRKFYMCRFSPILSSMITFSRQHQKMCTFKKGESEIMNGEDMGSRILHRRKQKSSQDSPKQNSWLVALCQAQWEAEGGQEGCLQE